MSKFSPAQQCCTRKTSHKDRLFPGKAENNLCISFLLVAKNGTWRMDRERVSSRPPAGALEGLLLPSEENPSPPRHSERKMLKRIK